MRYDTTVYIGWYIKFKRSDRKFEDGFKKVRKCTGDDNHKIRRGDQSFCSECGSKIEFQDIMQYKNFPSAWHMSSDFVEEATNGLITVSDLESLGNIRICHVHFSKQPDHEIVFCPGYMRVESDQQDHDKPLHQMSVPSDDWIEKAKKVFDVTDVHLNYGYFIENV